MNFSDFFFGFIPLIIVILIYILPIIIGYSLFKNHNDITTKNKIIWYLILFITNYIGLIGLYIFLNTQKKKNNNRTPINRCPIIYYFNYSNLKT